MTVLESHICSWHFPKSSCLDGIRVGHIIPKRLAENGGPVLRILQCHFITELEYFKCVVTESRHRVLYIISHTQASSVLAGP